MLCRILIQSVDHISDCCVPTTRPSLCPGCKKAGTNMRVFAKQSSQIVVTINGKYAL